jgi:aspartate dehydrogenase
VTRKPVRVAFIGWGAINSRVGALLAQRHTDIEIVGIATIDAPEARAAIPAGIAFLRDPSQLANIRPDLVVEAAGRAAIDRWAPAALAAASTLIIASTSAFCDDALLPQLVQIAERHGSRIVIAPGAIGGLDALAGAAVLDLHAVLHQIVKPPLAWKGTPAEKMLDLAALAERVVFFSGSAREAAGLYPQNANATIVTSLAGLGVDRTKVELVADPAVRTNGHHVVAEGAFGRMEMSLQNNPLQTNPKSSELAALSLVRLIEQRTSCVAI